MVRRAAPVAAAFLLSTVSHAALAQSASPGTVLELDPVVVEASRSGAEFEALQERLNAIAGGVSLVDVNAIGPTANLTMARALESVPGVIVQNFFGGNDQPRIQIRGSGLQQNPVERGILMLQDGLPLNRADGSYIVGFADPQQASAIEVFRGYTANRLGATVLGGAVNFISPTGISAPGTSISASGGSFGQVNVAGRTGFSGEKYDGLLQADFSSRDGFRDYNSSRRVVVGGNVGFSWSENVKTRVFASYRDLAFDVAGPLPWDALKARPSQNWNGPIVTPSGAIYPGPNVHRDRPRREASQFLVGSRTTATFGSHILDGAIGYTYTDDTFRFPISSGVRTTKGGDVTLLGRYAYKPDAARPLPLFETTALYTIGSADRGNYLNIAGQQGPQFGQSDLDASTLSLHAGFHIPLWEKFTLSPAISYSHASRKNTDNWTAATRPTVAFAPARPWNLLPNGAVPTQSTSYNRSYDGWSPSLGLTYQPTENHTLFAAVSRSFEPPSHEDLLATVNGTPNSSPGRPNPASPLLASAAFVTPNLDAQTATTIEAGWRGRYGNFSWDAATYYSWVDNELLNLRDATGASIGAINADKTTHFGVELGAGAKLWDRWSGRVAYTYQDFRFDNDPLRGDNQLAGAPRHFVTAALQFQATDAWTLQGSVRWSPARTPVDNMNTLYADSWVVVDLRTEYRINDTFTVFGEVTNVFDETYAGSTVIVDQARADQSAFLPGDGRGFYAGVKASF
ncbi:TonB-dependent receptor family protein [Pseudochelatococcus contaminans]|uniref:Iron complex outermembrane receptor protein n=1 Tax=Pseudochelatococcus contaminans TaxID=1538103 RepID=A0A7W6EIC0_9HYPH|nr:TonB-dependent receptor [Pseudochelatococcus contaminans]MBB3810592.1 iron complex outermembrane receptor protein [Pseudochelatococcus contaminans]